MVLLTENTMQMLLVPERRVSVGTGSYGLDMERRLAIVISAYLLLVIHSDINGC